MNSFFKKCFRFFYFLPRRMKFLFLHHAESFLLNSKSRFSFIKMAALYILVALEKKQKNVGSLWSKASWKSVFASLVGNRFNLNHLGNAYEKEGGVSQKIERQVVEWNKKIIHCHDENVEGYVCSGGTESNLFLMWVGREYLRENGNSSPTLLVTDFTHYSLNKAGRILDIDIDVVRVDDSWGMDLVALKKTFLKHIKRGKFSFLLPITIGYSSTGASDPLSEIIELVEKLNKKYVKFSCFMWVDAAAQGLPKSFLESDFKPLENKLIQGYVVDFHKYGRSPLPSGVVLYRSNLKKLIEAPINYLLENDTTVLGSRPGFSSLAIWANITGDDMNSWKEKFRTLEKRKRYLIKKLQEKNPKMNILSFNNSLTFAVEINSNFKELPGELTDEYSFVKCNVNGFVHYKFHLQF